MKSFSLMFCCTILSFIGGAQTFSPQTSGVTTALNSICFVDDFNGYVAGNGGVILHTTDGGINWSPQVSGVTTDLNEVEFKNASLGYAVGRLGVILTTTDGGQNWVQQNSGVTSDLTRLCVNGSDIYVSGYSGVVLKSIDGGVSWSAPMVTGTTTQLYEIWFTNLNTGYVVGNFGTILKTNNAGATWTPLTSATSYQLLGVTFTDSLHGFAVGGDGVANVGVITKTSDGGATWTALNYAQNYFGNVKFLTPTIGFVVGGSIQANTSSIYRTSDGGGFFAWVPTSSNRQFGASFPSFNAGYTCGLNGTILKTSFIDGIEEGQEGENALNVFPNPGKGIFNFTAPAEAGQILRSTVYSATGQIVCEQNGGSSIDLTGEGKGIYFLEVICENRRLVSQIAID